MSEHSWIVVLFIVGGIATAAVLAISVVSIGKSVVDARRRPAVADALNDAYQERRRTLRVPLEEKFKVESRALHERRSALLSQGSVAFSLARDSLHSRMKAELDGAEDQAKREPLPEFRRHGLVPNTFEYTGVQHYAESVWQLRQALRPQIWSASLLAIGVSLQTWASIWALFVEG